MAHRGRLRVYLGMAPGVGKTVAMLGEGHRRSERGTDVVVAVVEDHGRRYTREVVEGLEVVPRRLVRHRGATFAEMDLEAVLARRPAVALVDELAHTNVTGVPGERHDKRWQDVEQLLDAGIDVISTVNVQHLESLNDVVTQITGVRQQETLPDEVVRRADQIELVDMSAEALRRRLAHGNVYALEKVDAALTNYFRAGNLSALRELALLWVADRVDDALERYRTEHDIEAPWPARERVVVALTGGAEGEVLVRRGARIAQRASGGELLVVHVSRSDGLTGAGPDAIVRQRALVESLGGSFHTVVGEDVAAAVLDFARGVNASQIVLGASRRGRLSAAFAPGVGPAVVRDSGDIDVHIVTHTEAGGLRLRGTHPALGRRRVIAGWAVALAGPPLLNVALSATRHLHGLPTVLLLFLALTVVVALVGGLLPALVAALASGLLANYFFTPPTGTFAITHPEDLLAIVVLVAVGAAVSVVVDIAARRTVQAARARAEADTLTTLAGSVLKGDDALPALLELVRETFGLEGVALLERRDGHWTPVGSSGLAVATRDEPGVGAVPVREDLVLVLRGRDLPAEDLRVLTAVALQADTVLERDRLRSEARAARRERERTTIRTALLAAVSHDLRTPLAGIKAGVGSLRSPDIELGPDDRSELLCAVEESADRLQGLIDNLLDMSRLDSGNVVPRLEPVALDELVPRAIAGLPEESLRIDVPESLPLVQVDAGLVERVVANVAENAVRHSPPGQPVLVSASDTAGSVVIRVADRGPGVRDEDKPAIFLAFQRLGDAPQGQGVGLGLAVARGLAEANGGTLDAEDTPGGGLTMVLTLPAAGDAT